MSIIANNILTTSSKTALVTSSLAMYRKMNVIYYVFEFPTLLGSWMNSQKWIRMKSFHLTSTGYVEWRLLRTVTPGCTLQGIHGSIDISRDAVVGEHSVWQHDSAEPWVWVSTFDYCVGEFPGSITCVHKCHTRWHKLAKDVTQCSRNI